MTIRRDSPDAIKSVAFSDKSASIKNLIELTDAFDKLEKTNFRVSKLLLDEALEREKQRKAVS